MLYMSLILCICSIVTLYLCPNAEAIKKIDTEWQLEEKFYIPVAIGTEKFIWCGR